MESIDQRISFTCPRCHRPGTVALRQIVAGATIACRHCRHPLTLIDDRRPVRAAARAPLSGSFRPRIQRLPS